MNNQIKKNHTISITFPGCWKMLLMPIICCFFLPSNIESQSVEVSPFFPEMTDAVVGQTYPPPSSGIGSFQFRLTDGVTPNEWAWTAIGSPDIVATRLRLNISTGQVEFQPGFSVVGGAANQLYKVRVMAKNGVGGVIAEKNYSLFVRSSALPAPCALRREYALVLDLSGSMDIDTDPGPGIKTRWQQLQDALKIFLPALDDLCSTNDRFKVIYFNGTGLSYKPASPPHYYTLGGPGMTYWNNPANIQTDLLSATPTSSTPMGAGVRDAIDNFFDPSNANRTIVLFSDGQQNVPLPLYDAATESIPTQPPGGTPINFSTTHRLIKVFSIGVAGCDKVTMQKIANPDEWYAQSDVVTSSELNIAFQQSIRESQRECSPRFIDYRVGKMAGDQLPVVQNFFVNRLVDQLIIRATTAEGAIYSNTWALFKDNVPITNVQPYFDGRTLRYSISLPYQLPDGTFLDEGGEWRLVFKGSAGHGYEFTVMAEDKYLSSDLDIADGALFYAGDVLPVKVKIELGGAPVDSAVVTAILLRPGEDLGDLAAKTDIDRFLFSPTDTTSLGIAKINALLADSIFLAKLQRDSNLLVLQNIGNGTYSGKFSHNNLTGTYRVVAFFDGIHQGLGRYEGWETKYVLLDFSRPEDIQLREHLALVPHPVIKGQFIYQLQITPVNKFGRMLGPGQENRIFVRINEKEVSVIDNLNGTYSFPIGGSTGRNPLVTVSVIDRNKPILKKRLFNLPITHPFGISLHTGITLPFDKLDPAYNSGVYGEIDLTYRFNLKWSIEAVGGYYGFKPDYSIVGGSLFGKYTIPALFGGGWNLHFAGGPGAFKPENEDVAFGYGLKAGLGRRLSAHLDLNADFAYYGLPKPGYSFGTSGLGICYFF